MHITFINHSSKDFRIGKTFIPSKSEVVHNNNVNAHEELSCGNKKIGFRFIVDWNLYNTIYPGGVVVLVDKFKFRERFRISNAYYIDCNLNQKFMTEDGFTSKSTYKNKSERDYDSSPGDIFMPSILLKEYFEDSSDDIITEPDQDRQDLIILIIIMIIVLSIFAVMYFLYTRRRQ